MATASGVAFHPFASVFPLLPSEELQALAENIKANGLREPITLFDGKVLDGRNRQTACLLAGVKPTYREFHGTATDALQFVWDENFQRRHLSSSQAAACVVDFERQQREVVDALRQDAEKRKAEGGKTAGRGRPKVTQQIEQPIDRNENSTDSKLASMLGTNRQYVADARKLAKQAPEEFAAVKRGEKTVTQVKRERKEKTRASRRERNAEKVDKANRFEDLQGRFATIVIDPPWDWGDEGDEDQLGRARPTYQTMTLDAIKTLDVPRVCDDDCHLYLWITNRSLPKGFQLLDAWGFRYITCLTWCKPSIGMGNYFRGSTEQVLFAVRGSQRLLRKDVGTWFQYPRGKRGHSSKPDEFFELVTTCSPGPFLEMFARSERAGWVVWGADV